MVLELSNPTFLEEEGTRRAQATARLIYHPSAENVPPIRGTGTFKFTAPIGPIEMGELKWYLEDYAMWPIGVFKERAQAVEKQLPKWGKLLFDQALPLKQQGQLLHEWQKSRSQGKRRFTVFLDDAVDDDCPEEEAKVSKEAATTLLSLPWELIHDNRSYLFKGAHPARVRRQLPNQGSREIVVTEPPIRILLVCPRPEIR